MHGGVKRTRPFIHSGTCVIEPCAIGENAIIDAYAVTIKRVSSDCVVYTKNKKVGIQKRI